MSTTRTMNWTHRRAALGGAALTVTLVLAACGGERGASDRSASSSPSGPAVVEAPIPATSSQEVAPVGPATTIPDPEQVKAAWHDGVFFYENRDYTSAVDRLRLVVTGRPEDAYAHYLLGLSLLKSGEFELAKESLVRSSELAPGSSRTWINLARAYLSQNDPQGALHAADSALAIEPSSAAALHQRGRALAALGQGDEALDVLAKAHDAEPENGYIANTLGYVLIQQGRSVDATPWLEIAREKLPRVAYVRNNLAVAYERAGRLDEAIVEFQAAVEAGDSDGKAAASLVRLTPIVGKDAVAKHEVETSKDAVVASAPTPDGSEDADREPE